jgi:hypothetical protein
MSAYNVFNSFIQGAIVGVTNAAIGKVIHRSIPRDGQNLLAALGVRRPLLGVKDPVANTLITAGLNSAIHIIGAINSGYLNSNNYGNYNSYSSNGIMGRNLSSQSGLLASHINGLTDMQAGLLDRWEYLTPGLFDSSISQLILNERATGTIANADGIPSLTRSPYEEHNNISTLTGDDYYAFDIVNFYPKAKYTYLVHFTFYQEYQPSLEDSFTFLIKKFDKPKITINHEEVNFYNFKSHIPKNITYSPVSLDIHDDIRNESLNFLVSYLRRVSPIFNHESSKLFETNGLDFSKSTASYSLVTQQNNVNIIESIKVYHLYNANRTMDIHVFNNPKIQEINLGDFDMADGTNGSNIVLEFVYDNYFLNTGIAPEVPTNVISVSELAPNPRTEVLTSKGAELTDDLTNLLNDAGDPSSKTNDDPATLSKAKNGDSIINPIPSKLPEQINLGLENPKFANSLQLNQISQDTKTPKLNVASAINSLNKEPLKTPNSITGYDQNTSAGAQRITPNFQSYLV